MEIISQFYTPNKEYLISIQRELKLFTISKYGKYNCYINFIDNIGRVVLSIQCNEFDFLSIFNQLLYFSSNKYDNYNSGYDCIISLNNNGRGGYFIYLSELLIDHPSDDEYDNIFSLSIFESDDINGNTLRISFNVSIVYIDDILLPGIYNTISSLPYFHDMNKEYTDYNIYKEV